MAEALKADDMLPGNGTFSGKFAARLVADFFSIEEYFVLWIK